VSWNLPACRSARPLYAAGQPGPEAVFSMESTGLGFLETLSAVRNATPERGWGIYRPTHSAPSKGLLVLNDRVELASFNRRPLIRWAAVSFLPFGTYCLAPRSSLPAYQIDRLQRHLLVPWNLPAWPPVYPVESTGLAPCPQLDDPIPWNLPASAQRYPVESTGQANIIESSIQIERPVDSNVDGWTG
jgi:hypothetical protein